MLFAILTDYGNSDIILTDSVPAPVAVADSFGNVTYDSC